MAFFVAWQCTDHNSSGAAGRDKLHKKAGTEAGKGENLLREDEVLNHDY